MNSSWWTKTSSWWKLTIWTVWDDQAKFSSFLEWYKTLDKNNAKVTFDVKSFSNYGEYYYSLIWAFLKWEWPDLFVLNNNDSNIFQNNILWLDPSIVSVDNFKKNFDLVFQNDLIKTLWDAKPDDETKVEYLSWIPLGYQIPMMFFNFSLVKSAPTSTWENINSLITLLKTRDIWWAIALWDGKSISSISNIFAQILITDSKIFDFSKMSLEELRKNIVFYKWYFSDTSWINENDYKTLIETEISPKDVKLFTSWQVWIIFWMPSLLENINSSIWTLNKTLIRTRPFPTFTKDTWNILVDYNYFVVNKNTKNLWSALKLISYFGSDVGQKAYLKSFNYYLPSRVDLLSARLEETLKPWYAIKYKDFYNTSLNYTSFNKGNKDYFDAEIWNILDLDEIDWVKLFDNFRKRVLCTSNSILQPWVESNYCN